MIQRALRPCLLATAASVVLWAGTARAAMSDAMQAVCKIVRPVAGQNIGGTGFVFREDEKCLWIMTAAHVLGGYRTCQVRFYVGGEESLPVWGAVVQVSYNRAHATNQLVGIRDLAIIKVARSSVAYLEPAVARLASPQTLVNHLDTIFSVGCPDMRWPSAWLGQVYGEASDTFLFGPNPIPGRSGSPIFDKDGEHVIGVIIWYGNATGRAISISGIYDHFPELIDADAQPGVESSAVRRASVAVGDAAHLTSW